MKKIVLAVVVFNLVSCSSQQTEEKISKVINNDSTVFYPIQAFLTDEKNDVDSTPYFLYKIVEKGGKRDSTPITKQAFDSLASIFTKINIEDSSTKRYYEENAFNDLTTNSITLTYKSINKDLPVQSIDVLLNRDNQRVKRIFISLVQTSGDTVVMNKLGWKTNESFYINRIIQIPGGKEQSEKNTIIWNKKE